MNFQRLTTKFKEKLKPYRSRSRSPSARDDSSQSLPNVQSSTSAPSATSAISQNAPLATAEDHQSLHSLPILTINGPAPEQGSSIQDPPALETGIELAPEPEEDDEEGKPAPSPSDEIWDNAYDELKVEEPALLQAYERILTTQLLSQNDTTTKAIEVAGGNRIDQHDKENRRSQMQKLVRNGLDKISRESKAKSRMDDVLPIINASKDIVTNVVKGVPQAALPWAAVSLSLELLTNPISETKANCTGVKHVVEQMNWYCELATLLFGNQDGITAGIQRELRTKLIDLYKKLLSFEIKSICSYYRHRGLAFLGDLIKLDDWKGNFKEIQDAEAFFNEQLHTFQSADLGQDVKQLVVHAKDEQAYRKSDEDKKCLRDLYITDPRMDKSRIETTKGGLVQDSWRWILNHPDFKTWLHDEGKRLLWVKGDPGKGKTMLLCGLVDEITHLVAQSGDAISYFFCQATMPTINNHLAVLRGLIWLLADQQPSLISHVREKYDPIGKDLFEGPNAWYSLTSIFRSILHDERLTTTYVIIDGLDECTTGMPEFLELIREALPFQKVKWILSSRNGPEIQANLGDIPDAEGVILSLELNATVVAAAVDAYISEKASKIKLFTKNKQLRDEACNVIREKANGTFLWVAIVFQQLQRMRISYGGLSALMDRLNGLPKDLTALYDRMLQQIEDLDSIEESKLCRAVLGICVVAYQPLRLQELATLAGFTDELTDPSELRILIETCGSFLTVKDETVYFIHQSSKEYLTTNSRAQSSLFANGTEGVHYGIAMHSVETMGKMLCRDIYKLHNPAILLEDISTPKPDPLVSLRYPCSYWLRHLCVSMVSFDLNDGKVLKFLKKHILHWLEVISLMQNTSEGVSDVIHFEDLVKQHYPDSELLRLVHDIRRFFQHNSWIINDAPLQIYLSAILFTPKLSIVRSLFEEELLSWIEVNQFIESHWSSCLQTIEEIRAFFLALSPDKNMLVTGSEWNGRTTITLWDVNSGKQIRVLGRVGNISSIIFSSDSKRVTTAYEGRVVSWDVDSDIARHHTWSPGAWPSISNDGKFIASRGFDSAIQIQDMDTGEELYLVHDYYKYSHESRKRVKWSNDGRFLAFGYKEVTIWDVKEHAKNTVIDRTDQEAICFSSDSILMAYPSYDETHNIKIWNLEKKLEVRTISPIERDLEAEISSLEFSTDSKLLAGGAVNYIWVWDVTAGTLLTHLDLKGESTYHLCWSLDCKILVSSHHGSIRVWDMTASVKPEPVPEIATQYAVLNAMAINNDYKLVATGAENVIVKVWDTTAGSELAKFETELERNFRPNSVAFSPDSKFIYTHEEVSVTAWDIELGTKATDFTVPWGGGMSRFCLGADFSFGGRLFAKAIPSGHVAIWDMSTGQETVRFTLPYENVMAMAFSNNAQYLGVLTRGGRSFGVWDAITGNQIKHAKGHEGVKIGHHSVAVSNDASRVLVGYIQVDGISGEIWVHNEGQKMIRLTFVGRCFDQLFGARESYITTWRGYIDLNGLQTGCETQDSYQTISDEDIRFEGYGLSLDEDWITWNGSNILWLPATYRPYWDEGDGVAILPLGLFIVVGGMVVIIGFSGPPPG
ncbi:WD40 repeat-like protein [Trichoderma citrinoviride]|uniref:WD40 repeat-like protein n=1 Tax=Trichoderma citrinoviride TaxID=58853 RepID=A0A2T4B773_9HYPO|nr:WD40 repeat-like protein [Trichoderma citrinoviride]PTB65061.1 WD40 repeat-like protein [Trichoderma citrinoviride]